MKQFRFRKWHGAALAVIVLILAAYLLFPVISHLRADGGAKTVLGGHIKEEAPISLRISCVGDVMVHKPQLAAQYDSASDAYRFDNNFEYIKPYIEQADLALCNLETTFKGAPYSGYPLFNAPETLANALKTAGFDVALTSNNHMMDTGFDGMQRTLTIAREAGLQTVGSRFEGEKPYLIVEVEGVKVGIVSYTYETPNAGSGRKSINGNFVSDQAAPLINSFSYDTLSEDMESVKSDIQSARQEGAQVILCYFHWGEEYQRSPNEWQRSIARQAADMGADVIFASHPHVLQSTEILTAPAIVSSAEAEENKSGQTEARQVPVFYSMGNFLSNQRTETLNNRYTEQGMIAEVSLEVKKDTGEVRLVSMDAIPTWVDKYGSNAKPIYTIVPLDSQLGQNPSLAASGHLARAREALNDVTELLGAELIRSE